LADETLIPYPEELLTDSERFNLLQAAPTNRLKLLDLKRRWHDYDWQRFFFKLDHYEPMGTTTERDPQSFPGI